MKKILLAIAAFLTALAGGYGATQVMGGDYGGNQPEVTSFSTSTSANTADIAWHNVNDYPNIGVTVDAVVDSGQFRVACSMQDTAPTLAASSTSNRWDYVDFIDTATESSIDGYTGITFTSSTAVRQLAIRNSVWKWCVPTFTASVDVTSGIGTTTSYIKRVDND
jgi:hypothetical protein